MTARGFRVSLAIGTRTDRGFARVFAAAGFPCSDYCITSSHVHIMAEPGYGAGVADPMRLVEGSSGVAWVQGKRDHDHGMAMYWRSTGDLNLTR